MPDKKDAPPAPSIEAGLTFMWTTPVFRNHLIKPDSPHADILRVMEAAVLRHYHEFLLDCTAVPGQSPSDAFFDAQRAVFERGGLSFLEADDDSRDAFLSLRKAWMSQMREYLNSAVGVDAADQLFEEESALRLFVWASVHEGCSTHAPHLHENSA
eukprot:CAMPEP_0119325148 /NCGR_PEP_ID=MMETSP1333-20130426/65079_1 /TAXON_ID=418940 /ORGANISM="Scyphosphaera apsteinii, Strain RCC1455" /LENGTH=155 /DNA_ID=CAMNT_0007333039 /DNA_START=130 /DNA_END=594 /DNA_ORIENTATION=-